MAAADDKLAGGANDPGEGSYAAADRTVVSLRLLEAHSGKPRPRARHRDGTSRRASGSGSGRLRPDHPAASRPRARRGADGSQRPNLRLVGPGEVLRREPRMLFGLAHRRLSSGAAVAVAALIAVVSVALALSLGGSSAGGTSLSRPRAPRPQGRPATGLAPARLPRARVRAGGGHRTLRLSALGSASAGPASAGPAGTAATGIVPGGSTGFALLATSR